MNSAASELDYRIKLDVYYDELVKKIDVFVENCFERSNSEFIKSSLIKQRDEAVIALEQDKTRSLQRLDELYNKRNHELISEHELFNNSTLLLTLDQRVFQLGIIRVVDKWLSKEQVDLFQLIFLNDRLLVTKRLPGFEVIDEDATQALMNKLCLNYKFSYLSMMHLERPDFDSFLHNNGYQSNKIVEIKACDLFKINRLEFKEPIAELGGPVIIRPEATFLFQYVDHVFLSFHTIEKFDPDLGLQVLGSFMFQKRPQIHLSYCSDETENNLKDVYSFDKFKGQKIDEISILVGTSLITSRFFYGLDRLETLKFTNHSTLYSFEPAILECLTSLRKLTLEFIEVDLFKREFITHKALEELSFEQCPMLNDQISPKIFVPLEALRVLRFTRSLTDETDFTQAFGRIVHGNIQTIEMFNFRLHCVDDSMFTEMPKLIHLDLDKAQVESIPSIRNSAKLERLSLRGNNRLSDLKFLASTSKLVELFLSDSCITSLSFLTGMNLVSLRHLALDKNGLDSNTKADLSNMINLEYLNLSHCGLSDVPFKGVMSSLKKLVLSNNDLYELNKEMFIGLPNLIQLDVSANSIDSIESDTFMAMTKLEVLILNPDLLGITQPVYEWPVNEVMLFKGLTELREVRESPEKRKDSEFIKFKVFASLLNKYIWVIKNQ